MEQDPSQLLSLWREAANEMAAWCSTSTTLDYKKLEARVEAEGMSFLTITLPRFSKDFENCLDLGTVESYSFAGFKRKGGLPLFLRGFLTRIFDPQSGSILDDPCIDSIFAIRQLTMLFGKILLPCSDARVEAAMQQYIKCEDEIAKSDESIDPERLLAFASMSDLLFGELCSILNKDLYDGLNNPVVSKFFGKHGPGATADGLLGNQKYNLKQWSHRLEAVFPFGDYATPSVRYHYRYDDVQLVEPEDEQPVKVVPVPKTLKAPRIIAIEPSFVQFMQQSLSQPLCELLDSNLIAIDPIYGSREGKMVDCLNSFIGIADQNPNREMAREGSMFRNLATLDLSEASDRVSNQHVKLLFGRYSLLSEAVQATRSLKADVPVDGGKSVQTLTLNKFASMGSALCFPVEAMVFLTIVFLAIQRAKKRPLTRGNVRSFLGLVRVYGDDIIVPVDYVRQVILELEAFGLKVNMDKSFWNGKFRESCGGDYYGGEDVTPVRVRRMFPTSLADVHEVISVVALRNLFYSKGLWMTAAHLDDKVINRLLPVFPIVEETSPALGRLSVLPYREERHDSKLHRPLVKACVSVSRPPSSQLDGIGALLKFFLKQGEEPFADEKHLERLGRPRSVYIKTRWTTPY
jgi:hypothetical protein